MHPTAPSALVSSGALVLLAVLSEGGSANPARRVMPAVSAPQDGLRLML